MRFLLAKPLLLLALSTLLLAACSDAVTFNDGGTHFIDAAFNRPLDPVVMEDSPEGLPRALIARGPLTPLLGHDAIQSTALVVVTPSPPVLDHLVDRSHRLRGQAVLHRVLLDLVYVTR